MNKKQPTFEYVTDLETSQAIERVSSSYSIELPKSDRVYRHWRGNGNILVSKKRKKWFDYPKYRMMPGQKKFICHAYTGDQVEEIMKIKAMSHILSERTIKLQREIISNLHKP